MKGTRAVSFALAGVLWLSCLASISLADILSERGIAVAEHFAATVDTGDFQAAYQQGSVLLQRSIDEQDWIRDIARLHDLLGPVEQRSLRAIRSVSNFPHLPDGDYLILHYDARTTYKEKAAEVILIIRQNNLWSVCAYSIR
ncbi:MAG: DUF4019 domain-containing protein [Pelovirga sp.]